MIYKLNNFLPCFRIYLFASLFFSHRQGGEEVMGVRGRGHRFMQRWLLAL
jgi:hypothetical protein